MGMSIALTLLLAWVCAGEDATESLLGLPDPLPTDPDAGILDFPTIYPPTTGELLITCLFTSLVFFY